MRTYAPRAMFVCIALCGLGPPAEAGHPPDPGLVGIALHQLEHLGDAASRRILSFVTAILPAVQKLAEEGRTTEASQLAQHAVDVLVAMGDGSVRVIDQTGQRWLDLFVGRDDPVAIGLLLPAIQSAREAVARTQEEAKGVLLPWIAQSRGRALSNAATDS